MPVAVELTLAEMCGLLEPPMAEAQLRAIIRALAIKPAGWKHQGGGRGHPVARYDAAEIFRLHQALSPWLAASDAPCVTAGS